MPNTVILGLQSSGRARRWPGDTEPTDSGEQAALALARRLEAHEGQFVADVQATWTDDRVADVVRAEKLRAIADRAQADLDAFVEAVGVMLKQVSERYARLLPAPPEEAGEIRAALRARPEDLRRRWVFEQRELAGHGDKAALGRLAAVVADPLGELVAGRERTKLVETLMSLTNRPAFEAAKVVEGCLDMLDGWTNDNRAFYAQHAGFTTRETFFAAAAETKRRREMRFGGPESPDNAA